jgi:hypothetical protein
MHPIMAVGLALAFLGFTLFAGALFSSGGAAKSRQFQVIGEVLGGRHGGGRRLAMLLGLALCAAGTLTTFAGVAQKDAGRADRCQAYCVQQGYTSSAIGPGEETPAGGGRSVRFVACTCTRADGGRTQTRANDL